MTAVGVIPARGGSKGLPRKNIRAVGGKPLLAYTAEAAHAARSLDRCILSTDDPEIAEIGRRLGLEVPFLRPAELATDNTPSVDVLLHAAERLASECDCRPEFFVLLQPTAPLRTPEDIDNCVTMLAENAVDSVVSVAQVPQHLSYPWQLRIDEFGCLRQASGDPLTAIATRRQDIPQTYFRNGAVYAVRRETLCAQRTLYGNKTLPYVMPPERSVSIDGIEDLDAAELLIRQRSIRPVEVKLVRRQS